MFRRAETPARRVRCGWPRLLVVLAVAWIGPALLSVQAAEANGRYAGFVMEATTGEVFYAENADSYLYPASLTKMMTLYLVFRALERGQVSLDSALSVSANANAAPPSRIPLTTGGSIRVEDAIYALVTKSANNVAVVVAENLAGSETAFAREMTLQAQRLGMNRTTFRNASGLPNAGQRSTARDMARLAQALIRDFPQYYPYFATESWRYRGTTYRNHNRLLGRYAGMDGLKTGYIRASGYNLVASAVRGRLRLIGVVFGGRTGASRNEHMADLLDRAFATERGAYLIAHGARPFTPPIPVARPATLPTAIGEPLQVVAAPAPMPDPVLAPASAPAAELDDLRPLVAAALAPANDNPLELVPTAVTAGGPGAAAAAPPVPAPAPARDDGLSPAAQQAAALLGLGQPTPTAAVAAAAHAAIAPPAPQPAVVVLSEAPGSVAAGIGNWGIQVGAFATAGDSQQALLGAARSLPDLLTGTAPMIMPVESGGQQLYRARLIGLDQAGAMLACQALADRGQDCIAVAPGS